MNTWADYSGGRISGAALVAAGIAGVIRYVAAGSLSKRITRAEYLDLKANGIVVQFVVETNTMDADGGYPAGLTAALRAEADLDVILGGDPVTVVYGANDKQSWSQIDVDYMRAFGDVFGKAHAGAYGFGSFLAACHTQAVVANYWLAGHPPSSVGMTDTVNVWQRQGTTGTPADGPAAPVTRTIGGVACDMNNYYGATPPVPPIATAEDDAMFMRCALDPKAPTSYTYAVLSGPMFVGLGPSEASNVLTEWQAGRCCLITIGLPTWQELDKRSHAVCDNPRPVVLPTEPANG